MFERFFNYANELFCITDLKGNFLEVNNSFSRVLGFSKEYFLSKNFSELIHPEDIEPTHQAITSLAKGKNPIHYENRYIDHLGQTHVFKWQAYPNPDSNMIYAVARDVTEERLNYKNYTQIKHALINNVIFAKTDNKGVITEVNQLFCQISGYSRQELIGQTHHIVNSGKHPKSFFVDMWKTLKDGKVWHGAITNRKKNGQLYIVESILTPIIDLNGKIESFIAIRFDITEQIQYQQESAKVLKILNETSAIAKIGGWELNIETGVLSWTDETFNILGVQKRIGYSPILPEGLSLFIEEHKPVIDNAVMRGIEHGEPYALELKAKTPDGQTKWIYTDGKANYKNGKRISLSGTIQDIHEKKITELKYNEARQKSIQNAKFAALGELAASIAHEINNPLSIISGYAEVLKLKSKNGNEQTSLDSILKSCDRIEYIVKNLKKFSRSDLKPQKCEIDLVGVIKESISLTMPKIKLNLISFSSDLIDKAPIFGNEIEIEQVLINLINNAIDAIEFQASKWIKLTLRQEQYNYKLTIEDSGQGIAESVRIKMFEPFYTTKETNKGTGLGLSVVKGIIDDHNATINICLECSHTCFILTFPKTI